MKEIIKNHKTLFIIIFLFIVILLSLGINIWQEWKVSKIKKECISYSLSEMVDNLGWEYLSVGSLGVQLYLKEKYNILPTDDELKNNLGRLDAIRDRFFHFCLKIKGVENFEKWEVSKWKGVEEVREDIKKENFNFWMNSKDE